MRKIFTLLMVIFWHSYCYAETSEPFFFYYRISDTTEYHRYYNELIKLALDKTTKEFGPYKMIPIKPAANTLRAQSDVSQNKYGNMVFEQSYDPTLEMSQLTYIPIPIDGGIGGYRICFVSPSKQKDIAKLQNLAQLKKYTIAQGIGWTDSKILKENGFNVVEIANYANIFKLVVSNRVDLFCRGANQIKAEMLYSKNLNRLDFDRSFVLVYDAPRFFYLHNKNMTAKTRIEKGLVTAFKDGSLKLLWEAHHRESINYIDLSNRKVFHLDNPLVKHIHPDYKHYYFNFLKH